MALFDNQGEQLWSYTVDSNTQYFLDRQKNRLIMTMPFQDEKCELHIVNMDNYQEQKTYVINYSCVEHIRFISGNQCVIVATDNVPCSDNHMLIVDFETGKIIKEFNHAEYYVGNILVLPHGDIVTVEDNYDTLHAWCFPALKEGLGLQPEEKDPPIIQLKP